MVLLEWEGEGTGQGVLGAVVCLHGWMGREGCMVGRIFFEYLTRFSVSGKGCFFALSA